MTTVTKERRAHLDACVQRFRPIEQAVPLARKMLDAFLESRGGLRHLRHDARLVISELVTNALRVTPPDAVIVVRLRVSYSGRLLIDVFDPSPIPPKEKHAGPEDIGGRGLLLVRSYTHRVRVYPYGTGKYVRAEMC